MELGDWLNSINNTKKDLLKDNPEEIRSYVPFIINKCLSRHVDSIMYANEMNIKSFIDKDMQYYFYLNSLRKRKRYSPFIHKDDNQDLEIVKNYYGFSSRKAQQALKILRKDQLKYIRKKLNLEKSNE
jgi:hypothetical protein